VSTTDSLLSVTKTTTGPSPPDKRHTPPPPSATSEPGRHCRGHTAAPRPRRRSAR
jgi:hypothetical protein